jgi:peroxiredoxin
MAWRSSFISSAFSGYLLLSSRAEVAQVDTVVMIATNNAFRKAAWLNKSVADVEGSRQDV